MLLRDYQLEISDAIFREWLTVQSTLLVLPTGMGKTVIFADVIRRMQPQRCLVLAHRGELIWQAREKIHAVTGLGCEIEMAEISSVNNLFTRSPVVISTVQTQISGKERKRMHRFNPHDFGLVVIDEAHRSAAPTYAKILDHYKQNPNLKILGVTATPQRGDEESLSPIFQTTAKNIGILEGIEGGWLVDITQQFIGVAGLDYSHIHTHLGDLNGKELADVMESESNIAGVCHPSLEVVYGLAPKTLASMSVPEWGKYLTSLPQNPRRTIVFAASVKQAEACCNIFNRVVPNLAEWVCGKTDKESRRQTLERFKSGQTAIVVNVGILCEGYDNPGVEVIIMARATKSRSLYCQQIGRSTRPLAGIVDGLENAEARRAAIAASPKKFARVIDFVGNSGKHKLITCMDILSGKVSDEAVERAIKKAQKEGTPKRVTACLVNAEQEKKMDEERRKREEARQQEEARKAKLVPKTDYQSKEVNPFNTSHSFSGQKHFNHGKPLSEKQCKILRDKGINPLTISAQQGRKMIGILAANNWHWPKKKQAE